MLKNLENQNNRALYFECITSFLHKRTKNSEKNKIMDKKKRNNNKHVK